MTKAWNEGIFVGDRRPIARVTVAHPRMGLRNWSLLTTYTEKIKEASIQSIIEGNFGGAGTFIDFTRGHKVHQTYADFFFTTMGQPKELPNVRSVQWTRNIDQDVADCTIELFNTRNQPSDFKPRDDELDNPGWYTYSRGASKFSSRWGHTMNDWFGLLVPDNIIRTYEGYGWDESKLPEQDDNLVQTGVWMIDSVSMSATGSMSIKCRDVGRILMDQFYFPPVVPQDWYDMGDWESWDQTFEISKPGGRLKVKAQDSSNTPWIGNSLTHSVAGHTLQHAFDGDPNTYWLSIGNDRPSRRFAYEWVQCSVGKQSVSQVRVRAMKKGYTCYVSVKVGGVWQGKATINYHEDGIGQNGSDIKYVAKTQIDTEKEVTIDLPKTYAKAEAVRITFGTLQNFGFGAYKYRAGIRQVHVYSPATSQKKSLKKGPAGSNPNRYSDYTDIVKLLCAWGGFYWPMSGKQRLTDGTYVKCRPTIPDTAVLGKVSGRVWGDFQDAGVAGVADLDRSNFDKKTLMECIGYIKNILGFVFWIDELGGVQWRMPNRINRGCVRASFTSNPGYAKDFAFTISEDRVLMTLDATIDYKNVREANYVGDMASKIGAYSPGFNPNPTGLRRIGAWTDGNFQPKDSHSASVRAAIREARLQADLIGLAQLFTYRTDKIRIPAYPAIQIDDQIRIWERTTAEGYLHYVKGISSNLDVQSGEWTYDIDTHWLGFDPETSWVFTPDQMTDDTAKYLKLQSNIVKSMLNQDRSTKELVDTSDGL